jgi:flagellar biosynthesis/type III secretory pathway protein FliH
VEASQAGPENRQEVDIMAQTAVEAWIEEGFAQGFARGFAKGFAQGFAQGVAQGVAQGQLLNARTLLRTFLEDRFGPLPEALQERIATANDLERLQGACRQVLHLASLADLQF